MKSKLIALSPLTIKKNTTQRISLPIINAYAIDYYDFRFNGLAGYSSWVEIKDGGIDITTEEFDIDPDERFELLIYYHGIRDYEALFPFVTDSKLRKRMADFYEDAEKCFESSAWLPFLLMCGGLFEGMLRSQSVTDFSFAAQISKAAEENIITTEEESIMTKVRQGRNVIHASKSESEYIKRKDAMDIRKVLDKLIDKFCSF